MDAFTDTVDSDDSLSIEAGFVSGRKTADGSLGADARAPFCEWMSPMLKLIRVLSPLLALSDVLLIAKVYAKHKCWFLVASVICLVTFGFLPQMAFCVSYFIVVRRQCLLSGVGLLPMVNMSLVFALIGGNDDDVRFCAYAINLMRSALATYPLYVINVSFILWHCDSYAAIPIWCKLQLAVSLFTLCTSPVSSFVGIDTLYRSNCSARSSAPYGCWQKFKRSIVVFLFLSPIVCIELIHFFPALFAFFVDNSISGMQLVIVLLFFNAPKLLFAAHIFKEVNIQKGVVCALCSTPLLLLLPLVPYTFSMFANRRIHPSSGKSLFADGYFATGTRHYWNVVVYLLLAYVCSALYLLVAIPSADLSPLVALSLTALITLSTFVAFILPRFAVLQTKLGVNLQWAL